MGGQHLRSTLPHLNSILICTCMYQNLDSTSQLLAFRMTTHMDLGVETSIVDNCRNTADGNDDDDDDDDNDDDEIPSSQVLTSFRSLIEI